MAFMQLLIYVGAVAVLIFFAVMLTDAHGRGDESEGSPIRQHLYALGAIMSVGGVLSWLIMNKPPASLTTPADVTIQQLGHGLLESYFLAFELISVVLLVAMSGAVLLAWEKRGKK
jgi:NADH-quinone oxidoreductase subunit J